MFSPCTDSGFTSAVACDLSLLLVHQIILFPPCAEAAGSPVGLSRWLPRARCGDAQCEVPYARLGIALGEGPRATELAQRPTAGRCVLALSTVTVLPPIAGRPRATSQDDESKALNFRKKLPKSPLLSYQKLIMV